MFWPKRFFESIGVSIPVEPVDNRKSDMLDTGPDCNLLAPECYG